MWEELDEFHQSLSEIEDSFYRLAALEEELKAVGLRRASRWLDLDALYPLLESFPLQLSRSKKILKIVDHERHKELSELLEQTKLEALITRFLVKLKIAENERPSANVIYSTISLARAYLFKRQTTDIFAGADVSMESVLSAITRIKSLLQITSEDLKSRKLFDDEIFKPSNINVSFISVEIDAAISTISNTSSLGTVEREKLIEYLTEAKQELAKNSPAWKKVVGALVITATLLSGAAVAPEASRNVNNAINHILGSSIEPDMSIDLKFPKSTFDFKPRLLAPAIPNPSGNSVLSVIGDGLRLREKPHIDSTAIGSLAINSVLSLYEVEGDWYKVKTADDRIGWVNHEFVSKL